MSDSPSKKKLHLEIITQMLSLTTSGFGLVMALAWNSVIQEFVTEYIKRFIPNSGLISLIIYAIIVTTLAVVVTYNLSKVKERLQQ